MKGLLIAEKPSLMKSIQKVYNDKRPISDALDFACFAGHSMTLYEPEDYDEKYKSWNKADLPIIPENFTYKPLDANKKMVKDLNDKIKNGGYDYVINACDAAREGELIFYSFYGTYKHKLPVKRFWASDTTDASIVKALKSLIPETEKDLVNLQKSARLRAQMDWLYGMNFTRALSLAANSTIPVGRVMTPTLKMLVDRELEIKNFKPQDYYELVLEIEKNGIKFNALRLVPEEYKDTRMFDKKEADEALAKVGDKIKVRRITEQKETIYPSTLYSLLELQKDANRYFGYTASQTLDIAQKLYEERKLLSYPRTESRFLSTAMVPEIPKHLEVIKNVPELKLYVEKLTEPEIMKVLSTKKYVDDAKIADHHAIIVTQDKPDLSKLTQDEKNIYILVAKKLLSIFLPPYIISKTEVILSIQKEFYRANGKVEVQKGFSVLYGNAMKDTILPPLVEKEILPVTGSKLEAKKTTPPARYTDRTILDAMQNAGKTLKVKEQREILKEAAGLGTPATRSGILDKIEKNKWMVRKGKSIYATDLGISVIKVIGEDRDICSPALTAVWEKKLREIEDDKFIGDFRKELNEYIIKETQSIIAETKEINPGGKEKKEIKEVGVCPICGEKVLVGKNFYLCKNYKNPCRFIIPKNYMGAKFSESDVKGMLNGKSTKPKKIKFKDGKEAEKEFVIQDGYLQFVKKSGGHTISDENKSKMRKLGKCPKCGSQVLSATDFFVCTGYPMECSFTIKKVIKDARITDEDIEKMLKGEHSDVHTFTWKNGKKGNATIYIDDGMIKFDFVK